MKTNWSIKKLGEVAELLNGFAFKSSEYKNTGIKVLRMSNITKEGNLNFTSKNTKFLAESYLEKYPRFVLRNGDLVVAMTDMSKELGIIGKVTVVTDSKPLLLNQRVGKFEIINKELDKKFLYYALLNSAFKNFVEALCFGGLQFNVSSTQILRYQIPVPQLAVQEKIVERLDAIRKAQELNDLQISKTEELFKSIIQENILSNSNSWEQVKVRNLALMVGSGSTPRGGSSTYKLEGTPFIRSQNVLMLDLDLSDIVFIDEKTHKKMSRTRVYPQDVLLNITGASIGRVAIYPKSFEEANVNQHVCIIRVDANKVLPEYLAIFLATAAGQDQIWRIQAGGTRQGLNFEQVKDLKIFLPSVKEQERIIEKLSAVQEHKKLLLKQKSLYKELFDSILDKSMKGEMGD